MDTQHTKAANERWRRHAEDEAAARAVQQENAGATHQPVGGPPPYGNEQVNLIAAEIIAIERERCAVLVETWPVGSDARAAEMLEQVAARIRRRP
ncbi:hypothetical protein [Ramlibacter sp. Leaf400]|uniref:hypothetical protein n=1 Tax=Ramlibacter sp. Leaf400 TaxID=1736365 RepID=UPI0006F7EFE3|nr:hypothetical protein [Ramlibacter sp. Leaf400]KQT10320.1 hypothetical protein ASG30_10770 [Ramlibacter sp. Leaf400]